MGHDIVDVGRCLEDITFDVHCEARGLGDGEPEIQGDRAGNTAEADKDAPHVVDVVDMGNIWIVQNGVFVGHGNNKGNKGGSL